MKGHQGNEMFSSTAWENVTMVFSDPFHMKTSSQSLFILGSYMDGVGGGCIT